MKTILALLLTAAFASATSIQRYDRWICNFPKTPVNGPVTGTIVEIDYDLALGKGKALSYPECKACMFAPRHISVERSGHEQTLIYKNPVANFYLYIKWSPVVKRQDPHVAFLGQTPGTCQVLTK